MSLRFYAFDTDAKKAWKFIASASWWAKHDNGHAVSLGFRFGEEITERQLTALGAVEVPYEEWQHSGCQSSCVKRGGATCRW